MSKRRNTLLTRYCVASGPSRGWHNASGITSSLPGVPAKGTTGKSHAKKKKPKPNKPIKSSKAAKKAVKSAAPKPPAGVSKPPRPLVHCPHCGCSVRVTRLERHRGRCPKAKAAVPTALSVPRGLAVPGRGAEPPSPPDPVGAARTRLKQDNLLRGWLQRERKELLRRLAGLYVEGGIEYRGLCRLFEGRHILIEELIREFLHVRGLPATPHLDRDTLVGFREHVKAVAKGGEVGRLPLRAGVMLLSPESRAVLEATCRAFRPDRPASSPPGPHRP